MLYSDLIINYVESDELGIELQKIMPKLKLISINYFQFHQMQISLLSRQNYIELHEITSKITSNYIKLMPNYIEFH